MWHELLEEGNERPHDDVGKPLQSWMGKEVVVGIHAWCCRSIGMCHNGMNANTSSTIVDMSRNWRYYWNNTNMINLQRALLFCWLCMWWSIYGRENLVHILISMQFHTTLIGMVHNSKLSVPMTYHIDQSDPQCSQMHALLKTMYTIHTTWTTGNL